MPRARRRREQEEERHSEDRPPHRSTVSAVGGRLKPEHLGVEAARLPSARRGCPPRRRAVAQHVDAVGLADAGEPVRDQQHRAVLRTARASRRRARARPGSSAAVGSSRITNGASRKNGRASATRCHWPPERSVPPANAGPRIVVVAVGQRLEVASARRDRARGLVDGVVVVEVLPAAEGDVVARRQQVAGEVLEARPRWRARRFQRRGRRPDRARTGRRAAWRASSCPSRSRRRARRPRPARRASTRRAARARRPLG